MILSHAFLCTFIHTAYLREGGSYQWASQNLEQVPTKIQSQGFFRLSSFSGRQFNIASCLFSTENFKRLRILLLRRKQKQSYLLPFEYKPWKKNHACKITFRFLLRSYLRDVGLGFSEAFNILRQTFMTAFFTLSIVSMLCVSFAPTSCRSMYNRRLRPRIQMYALRREKKDGNM